MSEQLDLFATPDPPKKLDPAPAQSSRPENPCIWMFGRGPEGKSCSTCKRLWAHLPGSPLQGNRKCQLLYGVVQKPEWPACSMYTEQEVLHG